MNILSKFQLPSSYCLGLTKSWTNHDLLNDWRNNLGFYRTVLAKHVLYDNHKALSFNISSSHHSEQCPAFLFIVHWHSSYDTSNTANKLCVILQIVWSKKNLNIILKIIFYKRKNYLAKQVFWHNKEVHRHYNQNSLYTIKNLNFCDKEIESATSVN